ncbi:MAG: hypothetical protein ACT452_02715 [Microthrixaceae bacterium]
MASPRWGAAKLVAAVTATALLQLAVVGVHSADAATDDAAGASLGQAVHLRTATLAPAAGVASLAASVDVARSTAATDTGGLGGGGVIADATGLGVGVDVPGYLSARYALADRHAPTSEVAAPDTDTDTASKATVQAAGIVGASTLSTTAKALAGPERAEGSSTVQALDILPPTTPDGIRPSLQLAALQGSAASTTVAPGSPGVDASADSSLVMLNALAAGLPVDITVLTATATAENHGGTTTTAASCVVLKVAIDPALPDEPIACDPSSDIEIPGHLRLEFGHTTTTATSTRIVALTITTLNPLNGDVLSVIELGVAEASASRTPRPASPLVCGAPVDPGPASGGAEGTVLRVRDALSLFEADGGTSQVAIDEAGVPAGPDLTGVGNQHAATAGSAALQLEALPQPTASSTDAGDVVELNDAHATAPLASDESTTITGMSVAPPPPTNLLSLAASTLHAEASTATDPDDATNLRAPTAAAAQSVESLDTAIDLGGSAGPVPLALGAVQTSAAADRSPSGVSASSTTNAASLSATVGGVQIGATTIQGQATADAVDAGADGTTSTSFTIASLTVGGTTIEIPADTDGDGLPGPSSIDVPDPLGGGALTTVEFGMHTTEAHGPHAASIVVDPVVIRIPGDGGAPASTVVLGHMEASALAAAGGGSSLRVVKQVDIHHDALTFTNGGMAAPHQKIWFSFCVGNDGSAPLSNVTLTDTLSTDLRAIISPEPDSLPAGWSLAGQTLTRLIGTLAPGQEFTGKVLVEVRPTTPLGVVIPNTAVATASTVDPTPSNTVTITTGISPDQPALSASLISKSCDRTTRVLTLNAAIHNAPGAGAAEDAFVDALTIISGGHTNLTALPIQVGDIAPGGAAPITIQLRSPGAPGTPCPNGVLDVRERANDADGRGYAFD